MGSMKKKRKKRGEREWVEFQSQHQLSDADILLARGTGYPLKRFQELLDSGDVVNDGGKAQRIAEFVQSWQEKVATRHAKIEAGEIEPKKKRPKPKKPLQDDPKWAEAKQLCRLNMDDIRKAKELGLKPQALIRNVPSPSQKWKAPVKIWIQELYEKRIASRRRPANDTDSSKAGNAS